MIWCSKCARSETLTQNSLVMTFRRSIGISKSRNRQAAGESYHCPHGAQRERYPLRLGDRHRLHENDCHAPAEPE